MPLSSLLSWSPCPSSSILFRGDVCLCDTNSYQRRRKRHRSSVLVKRCKRTGTAVYWMRLPERQREAGYVLLSTSLGPPLSLFFCKNCRQTSSKFLEVYTIATILPVLHFLGAILFWGLVPQLPLLPQSISWENVLPRHCALVLLCAKDQLWGKQIQYRFTSQLSNPSFSSYVWYVLKSNMLDTRSWEAKVADEKKLM